MTITPETLEQALHWRYATKAFDRLLGLEAGPYRSWVVCAAGYRAADDRYAQLAKVRYPASELIEVR